MGNYVKITDFAVKDSLLTGNPLKLITGTAHDNEYNAISTAIATKVDSGGALGTPSSGTLTNCTGLPLAGVTDSTTEALGVGSLELGHASDTTLTRASAGVLAVEGVNVLTTATGAALAGSVSQAFSVASLEVGNASDTTITRASAGTIAVEGVSVLTTSTGAAIGGSTAQAFACSNLAFPAVQVASANANTLDDYEEGTFTPTIAGTTAAGTGTYTSQSGAYTKIGNTVHFTILLVWTAHTGTGNMNISGLPFTSTASIDHPVASISSDLALTAGNYLETYVPISSTQVFIRQVPTGGGTLAAVPIDTAATLEVCGHYRV